MMLRGIITEKRLRELIPSLNVLMPAEAEYMNMMGAHDEDRKCFSGKSNRLATAMEVQSDIAGIVGDTWEQCCQPRGRSTFLFGHQGPQAAYPWHVVTNSQLGWRYHVMEKAYEIERYDWRWFRPCVLFFCRLDLWAPNSRDGRIVHSYRGSRGAPTTR
jgi:hypothetical protein